MKKILNFIENFDTYQFTKKDGSKTLPVGTVLALSIGAILVAGASFLISLPFILISDWFGMFTSELESKLFCFLFVVMCEMLYFSYRYVERQKDLRRVPECLMSEKLFKRLYIIYVVASTVIAAIVEALLCEYGNGKSITFWYIVLYAAFMLTIGMCEYFSLVLFNKVAGVIVSFVIAIIVAMVIHYCFISIVIIMLIFAVGEIQNNSPIRYFQHVGGGLYIEY